jgi:hypothetical protein
MADLLGEEIKETQVGWLGLEGHNRRLKGLTL